MFQVSPILTQSYRNMGLCIEPKVRQLLGFGIVILTEFSFVNPPFVVFLPRHFFGVFFKNNSQSDEKCVFVGLFFGS